jgi:hypothetical protein
MKHAENRMKKFFFWILLMTGLISFAFAGMAPDKREDPEMSPPQKETHRVPSAEAISACSGKEEGATCHVGWGRSGVCHSTSDKKYFSCTANTTSSGGKGDPDDSGKESGVMDQDGMTKVSF